MEYVETRTARGVLKSVSYAGHNPSSAEHARMVAMNEMMAETKLRMRVPGSQSSLHVAHICRTQNLKSCLLSWKKWQETFQEFRNVKNTLTVETSPELRSATSIHDGFYQANSSHLGFQRKRHVSVLRQLAINLFQVLVAGSNSLSSESLRVALYVPWLVHSRGNLPLTPQIRNIVLCIFH